MLSRRQQRRQQSAPVGIFDRMMGSQQLPSSRPQSSKMESLRKTHKAMMNEKEANMLKMEIERMKVNRRQRIMKQRKRRMKSLTAQKPVDHSTDTSIKEQLKKMEDKLIQMIKKVSAKHESVAKELREKSIIKTIAQAPPGAPIASV